ncbi:MAG: hypothetical protein JO168_20415 [Solirubrobacterales bacterium]|nr:hypothetical protein [Solirubrobacterales bacterium]
MDQLRSSGSDRRCLSRLLGRPGLGVVQGRLRNLAAAGTLTTRVVPMVIVGSAGTGIVRRLKLDSVVIRIALRASRCRSLCWSCARA